MIWRRGLYQIMTSSIPYSLNRHFMDCDWRSGSEGKPMISQPQYSVTSASSRSPAIVIWSIDIDCNPRGPTSMIQPTLNSSDYHFQMFPINCSVHSSTRHWTKYISDSAIAFILQRSLRPLNCVTHPEEARTSNASFWLSLRRLQPASLHKPASPQKPSVVCVCNPPEPLPQDV